MVDHRIRRERQKVRKKKMTVPGSSDASRATGKDSAIIQAAQSDRGQAGKATTAISCFRLV